MQLKSLDKCYLRIAHYPMFTYDARGGGGVATFIKSTNYLEYMEFNKDTFSIPDLTSETTKILGIPMPYGLKIQMCMDKLEGCMDRRDGSISLRFESKFKFSILNRFTAPNLIVKAQLSTEEVKTKINSAKGSPLNNKGEATLVGCANVPLTGNQALDIFLGLPNEALAILKCKIEK